jgi:diadenosine tetraphosphate (Ap4A) HIT family hydrolase
MSHERDCCLCSQIEGRAANDLIARMLPGEPYVRRVMLESASFAVMPSLGPLVPGHCLLCPKKHVTSFARIDDRLHDEYEAVKSTLKASLATKYRGEVVVFEHGMAATGGRTLCTVDHAHMHFVPQPRGSEEGPALARGWLEMDGRLRTLRRLSTGREYIYYEPPNGPALLLASAQPGLESQYMRRAIAERVGRAEAWNWREAPDARAADETWRKFVSG